MARGSWSLDTPLPAGHWTTSLLVWPWSPLPAHPSTGARAGCIRCPLAGQGTVNNPTAKSHGVASTPREVAPFAIALVLWRRRPALGEVQVVDTRPQDQINTAGFPRRVYQHRMLARTQHEAADDTPFQCVEGRATQTHQAVGARVV